MNTYTTLWEGDVWVDGIVEHCRVRAPHEESHHCWTEIRIDSNAYERADWIEGALSAGSPWEYVDTAETETEILRAAFLAQFRILLGTVRP